MELAPGILRDTGRHKENEEARGLLAAGLFV